jgi:hypothetical protein
LIIFSEDNSSDEKCILAVERFSREYLSIFLDESFDKVLKQYTRETLRISLEYSYELGKMRVSNSDEKDHFINLISE